jgi:hypothetical protein
MSTSSSMRFAPLTRARGTPITPFATPAMELKKALKPPERGSPGPSKSFHSVWRSLDWSVLCGERGEGWVQSKIFPF